LGGFACDDVEIFVVAAQRVVLQFAMFAKKGLFETTTSEGVAW